MASVVREIQIDAPPALVWEVVGDFATGPTTMAPGYVTDMHLESPDLRVVTFANGNVVRERLIAVDDSARRIVWSWTGEANLPAHDNSSFQVLPAGDRSRLIWIHDVLPDNLADPLAAAMDGGLAVIGPTIERLASTAASGRAR